MKFIAAALALAGLVAAQEIQSKPFTLKLSSEDKKWDGKGVSSCHVGAAFESLCIGDHSELFHFNTTTGAQPAAEGYTPAGVLAWTLPTNPPFDEAMSLGFSPSSNVAIALFQPSYTSTYVSFEDKTGEMVIFSYIDDTVTPPKYATKALSQWYVCLNNYSGYQYNNLNWVVGGKPQNPSCSAVTVHRIFA